MNLLSPFRSMKSRNYPLSSEIAGDLAGATETGKVPSMVSRSRDSGDSACVEHGGAQPPCMQSRPATCSTRAESLERLTMQALREEMAQMNRYRQHAMELLDDWLYHDALSRQPVDGYPEAGDLDPSSSAAKARRSAAYHLGNF